jgi:hypothetical protein
MGASVGEDEQETAVVGRPFRLAAASTRRRETQPVGGYPVMSDVVFSRAMRLRRREGRGSREAAGSQ